MASFDSSFIDHELFKEGPVVIFVWKNEVGWPVETVTKNLSAIYYYDPLLYTSGSLKYSDQIHPDDLERVSSEVAQAGNTPQCSSFDHKPYRYLDGKGEYRWVKDSTRIIRNADSQITHYIGYLVDITTEVALKEETVFLKERLDLAWRATNDGLWDWLIDKDIVYFSDRWKEMIGFSPDTFPNESKRFFERIHADDSVRLRQALEYHFADPEHHLFEIDIRLRCKDGSYKWIRSRGKTSLNPDGTPHRMVGAHTDISERKEAELQMSLLTYSLDALSETILLMEENNPNFIYVNYGACRKLGYTKEALIGGMGIFDIDPDWNSKVWEEFWPRLEAQRVIHFESRHRAKNGRIFPVEITSNYFEYDDHVYNLTICRDITERKQAEK